MLGRPNPYRKTRAAGTLDDLMFDMDKRKLTSFRFQNYQNFITDRPGKMDERYKQKLSWCALDEETGRLDYLTEGLSPNNGRRMSTSSVVSREGGGDRDSLLPSWDALRSSNGAAGEDDAASNFGREDSIGTSPTRMKSPPLPVGGFLTPPLQEESGGRLTPKPNSGRSWVMPRFSIDAENRTRSVLHENSPDRLEATPPPPSLPEHSVSLDDGRYQTSLSLSPLPNRYRMHNPNRGSIGNIPLRRSPHGVRAYGTGPARTPASMALNNAKAKGAGGGAVGVSGGSAGGEPAEAKRGGTPQGGGVGPGEHRGGGPVPEEIPAPVAVVERPDENSADSVVSNGTLDTCSGSVLAPEGDGGDEVLRAKPHGKQQGKLEAEVEVKQAPEVEADPGGAAEAAGAGRKLTGEAAVETGEEGGGKGEDGKAAPEAEGLTKGESAGSEAGVVTEGSFGSIVTPDFSSGCGSSNRNSLLAAMVRYAMKSNTVPAPPHPLRDRTSEGSDYPRKSEESIYFSSTTSAGVGALEAPPAIPFFSGSSSRLSTESRPRRRRSGSGSMIVMAAGDPGLYLRPPVIGDTKLEHDRARRLGVANDLEAVIAELNRRRSILAWEDGDGVVPMRDEVASREGVPEEGLGKGGGGETNPLTDGARAGSGGSGAAPAASREKENFRKLPLDEHTRKASLSTLPASTLPRSAPLDEAATVGASSPAGSSNTCGVSGGGAKRLAPPAVLSPSVSALNGSCPVAASGPRSFAEGASASSRGKAGGEGKGVGVQENGRGEEEALGGVQVQSRATGRSVPMALPKAAPVAVLAAPALTPTSTSMTIPTVSPTAAPAVTPTAAAPLSATVLPPPSPATCKTPASRAPGASTPLKAFQDIAVAAALAIPGTPGNKRVQKKAGGEGEERQASRGRERVRGKASGERLGRGRSSRGASAPPPGRRDEEVEMSRIGEDIVTLGDAKTSMQDTMPFSGVPTNVSMACSPSQAGAAPSPSLGGVGGAGGGSPHFGGGHKAKAATGAGASSPHRGRSTRKGRYQVKDSFNRLRGWINGGFTSGGGRKNGNATPSPKTPNDGAASSAKGRGIGFGRGSATSTAASNAAAATAGGAVGEGLGGVGGNDYGGGSLLQPANQQSRTTGGNAVAVAIAHEDGVGSAGREQELAEAAREVGSSVGARRGRRSPRRATKGSPNHLRYNENSMSLPPPPMVSRQASFSGSEASCQSFSGRATSAVATTAVATTAVTTTTTAMMAAGPTVGKGLSRGRFPGVSPRHGDLALGSAAQDEHPQAHAGSRDTAALTISSAPSRTVAAQSPRAAGSSRSRTAKAARSLGATIPPLSPATRAASSKKTRGDAGNAGAAVGGGETASSSSSKSPRNSKSRGSTRHVEPSGPPLRSPKLKAKSKGRMTLRATSSQPKKQ